MESLIESCKKSAVNGMEWFLRSFSHVPDDRLNWSPSPGAKTSLRIAAHVAVTAGNFAKMLRERRIPFGDEIPVIVAELERAEKALTSRTEVVDLLRKNTDEVVAALDALTPEDVELVLDSSLGWTMPMTFLMKLPGIHAYSHTGQIDFLQTCWDDQEIYFVEKEDQRANGGGLHEIK